MPQLDWGEGLKWSNALADGDCGLTDSSSAGDWRLPNRFELESLVHLGYSYPYPTPRVRDNGPKVIPSVASSRTTTGRAVPSPISRSPLGACL
ncbi:hypothetical protein QUF64_00450 [Anaerolineales bacterium HSG6]|nr:hypothetical protein [Anaerolineales bacterium HSG6]